MTRIDSVLEQVQKDVEARGRSGAEAVFLTNVQFTIPREDFASPISCDVEGAICDVSWFFKCAKARMIVPCGNPDTLVSSLSFLVGTLVPYGSTWDLKRSS